MTDKRKDCPMRHENGNCTVSGGFCTAVNDPICEALHNAFDCGYRSALRQQEAVTKCNDLYDEDGGEILKSETVTNRSRLNEPLTLDELRQMDGEPVWVICDKGFEPLGLWALVEVCEESIFLTNNLGGRTEYANDAELEDDGLTVYRQKPEEGTV